MSIPDFPGPAVFSPATITGCGGTASATATVEVHIIHPFRGDLKIWVKAPDGTEYLIQSTSKDSGDDIHTTYVVNLSAESADGLWQLKVRDRRAANVGYLDSWTITV